MDTHTIGEISSGGFPYPMPNTYVIVNKRTASASGMIVNSYAWFMPDADYSNAYRMGLWTGGGVFLGASSMWTYIPAGGATTWYEFTWSTKLPINKGSSYYTGVLCAGSVTYDRRAKLYYKAGGVADDGGIIPMNTFTPTNFNPDNIYEYSLDRDVVAYIVYKEVGAEGDFTHIDNIPHSDIESVGGVDMIDTHDIIGLTKKE